jgi:hypothetical protein
MKKQLHTWGTRSAKARTLRVIYALLALTALVLASGAPHMFGN